MSARSSEALSKRIAACTHEKCTRIDGLDSDYIALFDYILKYVGVKGTVNKQYDIIIKDKWSLDYFFRKFHHITPASVGGKELASLIENLDKFFKKDLQKRVGCVDKKITRDQAEIFICCSAFIRQETLQECLAAFLHHCEFVEKIQLDYLDNDPSLKAAKDALILEHKKKVSTSEPRKSLRIYKENDILKIGESIGDKNAEELRLPRISTPEADKPNTLYPWSYHLTPLIGRGDEIAQLTSWLATDDSVSMMVLHGESGFGKSRLAFDFAEEVLDDEWQGGETGSDFLGSWKSGNRGILLIIDYPEEKKFQCSELIRAFSRNSPDSLSIRVRIIFVSRNMRYIDDILKDAYGLSVNQMHITGIPSEEDRYAIYKGVSEKIYSLGIQSSDHDINEKSISTKLIDRSEFSNWVEGDHYNSSPMMIIALAMYLYYSDHLPSLNIAGLKAQKIFRYFSSREARRIEDELSNIVEPKDLHEMLGGVLLTLSITTFSDGFFETHLRSFLKVLNSEAVDYPPPRISIFKQMSLMSNGKMLSVEPNIFAAEFFIYCMEKYACGQESLWTFSAIGLCNLGSTAFNDRNALRNFSRLGRIIHDARRLYKSHDKNTYRETAILNSLSNKIESNLEYANWISEHLSPTNMETSLRPLIISSVRKCLSDKIDAPVKARLQQYLALKLVDERHSEALHLIKQSVDTYTHLVISHPLKFNEELARALVDQSKILGESNASGDLILHSARRAFIIYENLRKRGVSFQQEHYATCLNNMSLGLYMLGRTSEAISKVNEALECYERLIEKSYWVYAPDLARTALNAATFLNGVEDKEEAALHTINLSVKIYRNLTEMQFYLYGALLADALNSLSWIQAKFAKTKGQIELFSEACDHGRESIRLTQKLIDYGLNINPLNLIRNFTNLSDILFTSSNPDDALTTLQEAHETMEKYAKSNFSRFGGSLVAILQLLSSRYRDLGAPLKANKYDKKAMVISNALKQNKSFPVG